MCHCTTLLDERWLVNNVGPSFYMNQYFFMLESLLLPCFKWTTSQDRKILYGGILFWTSPQYHIMIRLGRDMYRNTNLLRKSISLTLRKLLHDTTTLRGIPLDTSMSPISSSSTWSESICKYSAKGLPSFITISLLIPLPKTSIILPCTCVTSYNIKFYL